MQTQNTKHIIHGALNLQNKKDNLPNSNSPHERGEWIIHPLIFQVSKRLRFFLGKNLEHLQRFTKIYKIKDKSEHEVTKLYAKFLNYM